MSGFTTSRINSQISPLAASREGNLSQSLMGYYVNTVGDVNGDGYSDVAVFYRTINPNIQDFVNFNDSFLYNFNVYSGNANQTFSNVIFSFSTNNNITYLYPTIGHGDYNNDGISDFSFVITPKSKDLHSILDGDTSIIYFVYGTNSSSLTVSNSFNYIINNNIVNLATVGDYNQDGFSDLVCATSGVHADNNRLSIASRLYVFNGSSSGIFNSPSSILVDSAKHYSNYIDSNSFYGMVANGVDINGDGYEEIMSTFPIVIGIDSIRNFVKIYENNSGGLNLNNFNRINLPSFIDISDPRIILNSVQNIGDFNGDSYSDFGINYTEFENYNIWTQGALISNDLKKKNNIDIYKGNSSSNIIKARSHKFNSLYRSHNFFGDFNDDLYSDIILNNGELTDLQHFKLFNNNGIFNTINFSIVDSLYEYNDYNDTVLIVKGNDSFYFNDSIILTPTIKKSLFGHCANPAGDFNGDGYSDIIIGAPAYTNGQAFEGAFYVIFGRPNGGIGWSNYHVYNAIGPDSGLGHSVTNAGDVNGDGFSDVLVGAHEAHKVRGELKYLEGGTQGYNNLPTYNIYYSPNPLCTPVNFRRLGIKVSSIGDINGDGYIDAIASLGEYYDACSPFNTIGGVVIYLGSSIGYDTLNPIQITGIRNDNNFGERVSEAGDVDGDGFDDFLIGCPRARDINGLNPNTGRVYLYYGDATGVNFARTQLLLAPIVLGGTNLSKFGTSISTAGDINADGFSDIIIGANSYNDPTNPASTVGAAFIYFGTNTGLPGATPIPNVSIFGTINNIGFGNWVSCLGDINGDGFSDVSISEYGTLNNSISIVYGANLIPSVITPNRQLFAINQDLVRYGLEVSSAGDVNCDGFNDIIIGSPQFRNNGLPNNSFVGKAYLFYGSPIGIGNAPITISDSVQLYHGILNSFFGFSVSGGGDINGDGYSEVLIGSPMAGLNISSGDGKMYTYFGNKRKNNVFRSNFRITSSTSNSVPLSNINLGATNAYKIVFNYKNYFGGIRSKLIWETQNRQVRFNRANNTMNRMSYPFNYPFQSNNYNFIINNNSFLEQNLTFNPNIDKLRVRVKFNPADAINGQHYGPWRYSQGLLSGGNYMNVFRVNNNEVIKNNFDINIYPNPNKGSFNIISSENINKIEVFDLTGKKLTELEQQNLEIITLNLTSGIYIIKCYSENGLTQSKKIIIQQ